jgi:predicted lipoprotein with Yx(FWY)xxD motif
MTLTNRITSLMSVAAAALAAVSLGACGGGSSSSATSQKTSGNTSATVDAATSGDLGDILVDAHGRTLYLFEKDSGSKSTCFGACATHWPPLRSSGKATAGTGVSLSSLAVTPRSDGAPQVTYHGHPLYLFAGDAKPGDANGQGSDAFGAAWLALSPSGDPATAQPSASGGGGSSSSY